MNDLMERLSAARPTDAELDAMWSPLERRAVLARVRSQRARGRRRAWLAAAAVAGAMVVVPHVLDSGDAAAADLQALAAVAAASDSPALAPGGWLHQRIEMVQDDAWWTPDGLNSVTVRDAWIRWDGYLLAIDRRDAEGWTDYNTFPHREAPSFGSPTPEYVASLPTDKDGLRAYLDAHVSGSNSHEEAMFTAVADLANSGLLPPDTFAAALEVLADVDGVSTTDVTVDGRAAVEVSFEPYWLGYLSRHSITVDRATALVLSVRDSDPSGTYSSTTTLSEVLPALPDSVRTAFDAVDGGGRVWDAGVTPLE